MPSKRSTPSSLSLVLVLLLVLHVLLLARASSSSKPRPHPFSPTAAVLPSTMPDEAAAAEAASTAAEGKPGGTCQATPRAAVVDAAAAVDDKEERYEGLDNPSIIVSSETPLLRVPVLSLRPTQIAVGKHSVGLKAAKIARKREQGALDAWLRRHPIPVVRGPKREGEGDTDSEPPLYLIDHHHLAAALHSLGVADCYAAVVRDYSSLPSPASPPAAASAAAAEEGEREGEDEQQQPQQQQPGGSGRDDEEAFWRAMRRDGCLWPHDEAGGVVAWQDLPRALPLSVAGLKDDPYRSLAGMVRRAGGFEKSARPFAEFVWADHLRGRVQLPPSSVAAVGGREGGGSGSKGGTGGRGGGGEQEAAVDVTPLVPLALAHASHRDAEGLPGFTAAA